MKTNIVRRRYFLQQKLNSNFKKIVCVCVHARVLAETATYGRTINVAEGSRLNIYILLDTSGSIKPEAFNAAKEATIALISKVFYVVAFTQTLSLSRNRIQRAHHSSAIIWEYVDNWWTTKTECSSAL